MMKGLRPSLSRPLTPPPDLRQRTIEKMRNIFFQEILTSERSREELNKQQLFILDHAYLVVLFHQGEKSIQDIWRNEVDGHQADFSEKEITALNFIVLEEREKGQLESLQQKLEEKGAK